MGYGGNNSGNGVVVNGVPQAELDTTNANLTQLQVDVATKGITLVANTNAIASLASGSPKGVYATVALLTASFPNGNANIYVVTQDGKWYYWNGSAWTAGGIYQGIGIARGSVTMVSTDFIDTNIVYSQKSISLTATTAGTYKSVDVDISNYVIGETYTLSLDSVINNADNSLVLGLYQYNGATELSHHQLSSTVLSKTFVINSSITKLTLKYWLSAAISITQGTIVTWSNVLLVKGTELIATLNKSIAIATPPVLEPFPFYDVSYIANNKLYTNDSGKPGTARYNGIDLGAGVTPSGMNSKVIFSQGSSGASVALICNPNNITNVHGITDNSLHIVFTDVFVQIGIWVAGSLIILSAPNYSATCKRDGITEYTFGWSVSGTTITVNCPDGTIKTVTDSRIPVLMGRYCTLEHYWMGADKARPISTYFEILVSGVVVLTDNFTRNNGDIVAATTGQYYTQFHEV